MPSVHETAYPRLKSSITTKELTDVYTPTPAEVELAERVAKGHAARLCFLLLLKTFQRLGYFIMLRDVGRNSSPTLPAHSQHLLASVLPPSWSNTTTPAPDAATFLSFAHILASSPLTAKRKFCSRTSCARRRKPRKTSPTSSTLIISSPCRSSGDQASRLRISFGGGLIAENDRDEQRKLIKYNHLVANCLIFHNVHSLTRVLHELAAEGYEIDAGAVARLSPYLTEHINRFGKYTLNLERATPAPDYSLTFKAAPV